MPGAAADSRGQEPDRPRCVLIIDDDSGMRDSLAVVFENEGLGVQSARNGAEALDCLQRMEVLPDVIVLDLMMPVMNGWDFRAAQLQDVRLAGIPTLVLTAAGSLESRAHGELAMPHVLKKPIDLDVLLDTIEGLLTDEGRGN